MQKADSGNKAVPGMKLLHSKDLGELLGVTEIVLQQTIPGSRMLY